MKTSDTAKQVRDEGRKEECRPSRQGAAARGGVYLSLQGDETNWWGERANPSGPFYRNLTEGALPSISIVGYDVQEATSKIPSSGEAL